MPKSSGTTWERYVKADAPVKARIIARSFGEAGSGKSSFWLSAPGPIVIQSFDKGLEGVVEKFQNEKDIYVKEYEWVPTDKLSQEEAEEILREFLADYEHAIQHARTVVWDTETLVWELFRYAEFGEPNDAPRNYPKLNQRMRKYVNLPKALAINFGLIQSMRDEWKTVTKTGRDGQTKDVGSPTGRRVPAGFGELEGLVHININHKRIVERDGDGQATSRFVLEVGKARGPGSGTIQDQGFSDLSFVDFAQLAFPSTDESDWV